MCLDPFKQSGRCQDVKYAYQSMSIKEGNTFQVGPFKRQKTSDNDGYGQSNSGWGQTNSRYGKFNNKFSNKENWGDSNQLSAWGSSSENQPTDGDAPKMFQEYIILEREGAIDQVTIHYADIASLQMLGILSLDNYYHLSMIPPSLLTDASYVIRVFKTILATKKSKY